MSNLLFVLYIVAILLYNLMGIEYLFYLAISYAFYVCIKKYRRVYNDYYLIELMIYTIIIPNNYIVLVSLIVVLVLKIKTKAKIKSSLGIFLFILYLILNSMINTLMPINTLFYVIYFIPLPICALLFSKFNAELIDNDKFIKLLKKVLQIQGIGIITYPIFNLNEVVSSIDFDWVTGTFGDYQGNIFFFFCAFSFVFFLHQYMIHRKHMKYLILSGIYMIMTGSIALIILFASSVLLYIGVSLKVKRKTKMMIMALLGLAIVFFIAVTPTWIKNYIVRMASETDKSVYISKISDYNNVFFNSNNSVEFELFGAGIGKYSSRAALTCTGIYISGYNVLFEHSISDYTKKYIYNKLYFVYENRLGILDVPWAEYISIKGELGIIGLLFLALYFISLVKKNCGFGKIYVVFLILACFTENYLEYAKIVLLLYINYMVFQSRRKIFEDIKT